MMNAITTKGSGQPSKSFMDQIFLSVVLIISSSKYIYGGLTEALLGVSRAEPLKMREDTLRNADPYFFPRSDHMIKLHFLDGIDIFCKVYFLALLSLTLISSKNNSFSTENGPPVFINRSAMPRHLHGWRMFKI